MKLDSRETDILRLNDLAKQYGLAFRKARNTYTFEEFHARGLRQALGYVEGYDRAMQALTHSNTMGDSR